jgi:hypothetical protein
LDYINPPVLLVRYLTVRTSKIYSSDLLFLIVNLAIGLNDTIRINEQNRWTKTAIVTDCDSLFIKSRVVGYLEDSWTASYQIIENGEASYFTQDITLNYPTKTGIIEVYLDGFDGYNDKNYLELRKVLVAIFIA